MNINQLILGGGQVFGGTQFCFLQKLKSPQQQIDATWNLQT